MGLGRRYRREPPRGAAKGRAVSTADGPVATPRRGWRRASRALRAASGASGIGVRGDDGGDRGRQRTDGFDHRPHVLGGAPGGLFTEMVPSPLFVEEASAELVERGGQRPTPRPALRTRPANVARSSQYRVAVVGDREIRHRVPRLTPTGNGGDVEFGIGDRRRREVAGGGVVRIAPPQLRLGPFGGRSRPRAMTRAPGREWRPTCGWRWSTGTWRCGWRWPRRRGSRGGAGGGRRCPSPSGGRYGGRSGTTSSQFISARRAWG